MAAPVAAPLVQFSPPQEVAIQIYAACKGVGTKEDLLISTIARTDDYVMPLVSYAYERMYLEPLAKRLESETSGNFKETLVYLTLPIVEREARQLHHAIKGAGTDEACLVDLLCTKPALHVRVLTETYNKMYKASLVDDIKSDCSGDFKKLMLDILACSRSDMFDPATIDADAQALYKAGEGRIGTDESAIIRILTTRSFATLQKVAEVYKNSHKNDLETAMEKETSGWFKEGLRAIIITAVHGPAAWFAQAVRKSTKGVGTNDTRLIRTIVDRRSVDMPQIKDFFQRKYGETLAQNIAGDTSGSYSKLLLALIN